jgi:hypothetical protein|tara:strand:- start:49 stop:948 length:900 start_codon:yes stop_codon:yes gene_type:complete
MSTKIIGNQIDAATRAIIEALDVTEQINLPALNQSAINALGTPAYGTLVYNTTEDMAQIYLQDAQAGVPGWDDVGGGGPSVGENSIIRTNGNFINQNITVGVSANGGEEFRNGFTAGPVEIQNGYTVTIENGASWFLLGGEDNDVGEGQVMQLRYAQTPATRYLIRSQNLTAIPNLEVTIQPSHTNSKILLMAMINSNATHVNTMGFLRNNSILTDGVPGNSNVSSGSVMTRYEGDSTESHLRNSFLMYMDHPNTTNPLTYTVGASSSWSGSLYNLYINDRSSNDMRCISNLIAVEIRG